MDGKVRGIGDAFLGQQVLGKVEYELEVSGSSESRDPTAKAVGRVKPRGWDVRQLVGEPFLLTLAEPDNRRFELSSKSYNRVRSFATVTGHEV